MASGQETKDLLDDGIDVPIFGGGTGTFDIEPQIKALSMSCRPVHMRSWI